MCKKKKKALKTFDVSRFLSLLIIFKWFWHTNMMPHINLLFQHRILEYSLIMPPQSILNLVDIYIVDIVWYNNLSQTIIVNLKNNKKTKGHPPKISPKQYIYIYKWINMTRQKWHKYSYAMSLSDLGLQCHNKRNISTDAKNAPLIKLYIIIKYGFLS